MNMVKPVILLFFVVCSQFNYGQKITHKKDFVIGETITVTSNILEEDRVINIYLPNGYNPLANKTYPVIYLLDGSTDEDFIHVSGLVQFGSFSWINMIPETIVIGIGNEDRQRDFTYPTENKQDQKDMPTAGGSEKFIKFLELELFPIIKQHYKINKTSTLVGQSLGGLLACEILFKNPELFENYIIVSPSLWWDDESILTWTPMKYEVPKSIYIAVGKEGEIMERLANDLYLKLKQDLQENTKLFYKFFPKRDHGDALHVALYDAFEKLFNQRDN